MAQVQKYTLQSLGVVMGALLIGVVGFAAVTLVIGPVAAPGDANSALQWALLGVAGVLLVAHTAALRAIDSKVGKQLAARRPEALAELDAERVPPELFVRTLIAAAFGESIALLGPILYLATGSPNAAVPLVVGLGWLLLQLPSRDRLRATVERAGRPTY
jgi:hypothetical protein